MIWKIQCYMGTENNQINVKNTVECIVENINGIASWFNVISSIESRKQLINSGENTARKFLNDIGYKG